MQISLQKVITSNLHKEFKKKILKLIFFYFSKYFCKINHFTVILHEKWLRINAYTVQRFFHPWHGKIIRIKILLLNTVGRHLDQFVTLDVDYFQTAWLEAFLIALVFVFRVVWEGRLVFTYSTYWKLNISRNIRN